MVECPSRAAERYIADEEAQAEELVQVLDLLDDAAEAILHWYKDSTGHDLPVAHPLGKIVERIDEILHRYSC